MVLVFDLDDTLYNELTYVESGFMAVAEFLHKAYGFPVSECYRSMAESLDKGRGRIFDDMLAKFGICTQGNIRKCLSVYRLHKPNIKLYPEAEECLERFKHLPIYIVTDGNKVVQKNKLVALGLYERLKFCFITHRYGVKNAKPSTHCFLKICEREDAMPEKVVYIADNPRKDFVGIKPLGFKTVRLMRGQHKDDVVDESYNAEYQIASLDELNEVFIKRVLHSKRGMADAGY